jgi:hypothetical protein
MHYSRCMFHATRAGRSSRPVAGGQKWGKVYESVWVYLSADLGGVARSGVGTMKGPWLRGLHIANSMSARMRTSTHRGRGPQTLPFRGP